MKLVSGWKVIRVSQEVYADVAYRKKEISKDVPVPPGVFMEYIYLLFLKRKYMDIKDPGPYSDQVKRLLQIERIYGLSEETV